MKILLLTQWFEPEFTLKGLLMAEELHKLGHQVEVLTGFPNYPGGKVYPGYKIKPYQREMINNISVIRCALYPNHDNSALKRVINFVSFALSATFWGVFLCRKPDVIYAYHPPITIGIPAILLSWFKRAPFILDIQDFWPDTLSSTGMVSSSWILKCVGACCKIVYRLAFHIVVLSDGFKQLLISRNIPAEKITVIHNWADERYIKTLPYDKDLAQNLGFTGKFNIVFAGNFGKAQDLFNVLETAKLLKKEYPLIRFVMVGAGVDETSLKKYVVDNALTNVVFLPRYPISQIQSILSIADVLLLHLKNDPLFEITIPSKTQANLCAGRPILAVCKGDACRLIEIAEAGMSCEPGNPQNMTEKIIKLYQMGKDERDQLGNNGSRFYLEKLSLAQGILNTQNLLQNVLKQRK
jgi:colanic acid biosynthesis glycosyl transferase WcaI